MKNVRIHDENQKSLSEYLKDVRMPTCVNMAYIQRRLATGAQRTIGRKFSQSDWRVRDSVASMFFIRIIKTKTVNSKFKKCFRTQIWILFLQNQSSWVTASKCEKILIKMLNYESQFYNFSRLVIVAYFAHTCAGKIPPCFSSCQMTSLTSNAWHLFWK